MKATINVDALAYSIAEKVAEILKKERETISRKEAIKEAMSKRMVTFFEAGKLKLCGVGYHQLRNWADNGKLIENKHYVVTEDGVFHLIISQAVRDRIIKASIIRNK